MKKILICGVLLLSVLAFNQAQSQVRVNINIGAQPVWGPVGYDYVEYYYLPDIETYYVPAHQFIYLSDGRWIYSRTLPPRYRSYDLYNGYKVVINEPRAYRDFRVHRARYAGYRNNHSQVIIRNSNEPKYHKIKGHPKYKESRGNGHKRNYSNRGNH